MRIKVKPMFAWYDFWIGLFWDSNNRRLYFFPIPMFGFKIDFLKKCDYEDKPEIKLIEYICIRGVNNAYPADKYHAIIDEDEVFIFNGEDNQRISKATFTECFRKIKWLFY